MTGRSLYLMVGARTHHLAMMTNACRLGFPCGD